MTKKFQNQDDFLTETQAEALQAFFEDHVLWEFGSQSNRWKLPFGHWNHEFLNTDPRNQDNYEQKLAENPKLKLIAELWNKIKKEVFPDHKLVRCYANAHTYGIEGYPHVDHRWPGNYTSLIYVNPFWTHHWAGETVLINELGDIVHSSLPKPRRLLVFDGRITHAARSVSRKCPALRVSIVFKSKMKNSSEWSVPSKYIEYLKKSGAHLLEHSNEYSLLDHLIGTYQTLREFKGPEHVCLAGLFHSVYGTKHFKEEIVDSSRYEEIKGLIGVKASELVLEFSRLERPKIFEESLKFRDFAWKDALNVSYEKDEACNDLLMLECANILEQKGLENYPFISRYAMEIGMINALGI